MNEIALLGGGGFALELLDYLRHEHIEPVGYYDIVRKSEMSIPYLGDEKDYYDSRFHFIIASGEPSVRQGMIKFIDQNDIVMDSFVSSYAYFSRGAKQGYGVVICPNATVAGNAHIGHYNLINCNAFVGHDCILGENVIVSPGAMVLGHSRIDDGAYLGAGSIIMPKGHVGAQTIVGAGGTVEALAPNKVFIPGNDHYIVDNK